MALVSTKKILNDCRAGGYGVGAFNVCGLDEPRAIIAAAQRLGVPVVITAPGFAEQFVDFRDLAALTRSASEGFTVPVALHLSHAYDMAQLERACAAGFTSVMFDGSALGLKENIAQTAEAARFAHACGCAAEGELGALSSSWADVKESMTDPEAAAEFVAATGVDVLAVSIGNSHGFYKGEPKLDFERLAAIEEKVSRFGCRLTLHGGSGISAEDMRRAIACGITKICIYTEMCVAGKRRAVEYIAAHPEYDGNLDLPSLLQSASAGAAASAESFMKVFSCR